MDGRRRHGVEFHDQHPRRARSYPRKPPLATWQPTVPTWEKQFCLSVGSVPWHKLLDAKRFMYLFQDVVNWDDCAVEEAFHNAKKRYWAEFHGFPCDIPLPDPDVYIDQIDWNSQVDPELILDLERDPEPPEVCGENENGAILNSSLLLNHQSFLCAGWGNEEEFPKEPRLVFAPGYGDCVQNADNDKNSWEQDCAPGNETGNNDGWGGYFNDSCGCNETRKDDGWGSTFNDSVKCDQLGRSYDQGDASFKEVSHVDDQRGGGDWRTWNCWDNSQKREETGQYMSRYKTSRFSSNEYQMDQGWKNRKVWKRSNIACR